MVSLPPSDTFSAQEWVMGQQLTGGGGEGGEEGREGRQESKLTDQNSPNSLPELTQGRTYAPMGSHSNQQLQYEVV